MNIPSSPRFSKNLKLNSHQEKEFELSPRRFEILQIIRDHRQVSFDFIKRRFLAVPDRTLRYDLKKLADAKFVIKRGVTNKAVYEPYPKAD